MWIKVTGETGEGGEREREVARSDGATKSAFGSEVVFDVFVASIVAIGGAVVVGIGVVEGGVEGGREVAVVAVVVEEALVETKVGGGGAVDGVVDFGSSLRWRLERNRAAAWLTNMFWKYIYISTTTNKQTK